MNSRGIGLLSGAALALSVSLASTTTYRQVAPAAAGQSSSNRSPRLSARPATTCKTDPETFACTCSSGEVCPTDELVRALQDLKDPEFLILLTPDPVHTHLGMFYDRQIEAFGQAVQQGGYVFERSAMPWPPRSLAEHPDLLESDHERRYQDERERFPGAMIFRATGKPPLVALVVGERPTAGVNAEPFRRAVTYIAAHRSTHRDRNLPEVLRIVGPTFSGSLRSLGDLLAEPEPPLWTFVTIDSGSATSWNAIRDAEKRWKTSGNPSVVFTAFQQSDCYALSAFLRFANDHGYSGGDIVLLTEDGTAYGNATGPTDSAAATCPAAVNTLYFPREISHLRSAYQRDVAESGISGASSVLPRSTLKTDFTDPGNDDDTVATMALAETPLSQEAVLLNIVSTLEKTHATFVVIRATNPVDTVFLTQYLRSAYPSGRIVTIGADLLFRRESADPRLRGVVAVTSYSLIPRADQEILQPQGSEAQSTEREFPSADSVGTFNAALAAVSSLMSGKPPTRCAGSGPCMDLPPASYAQYGWPSLAGDDPCEAMKRGAPPLWLVALGDVGYWPVGLIEPLDEQAAGIGSSLHGIHFTDASYAMPCGSWVLPGHRTRAGPWTRPPLPWAWNVLCAGALLLLIGYSLLLWRGSAGSPSGAFANFAPIPSPSRATVLAWTTGLLGLLALLLIMPMARVSRSDGLDVAGLTLLIVLSGTTAVVVVSSVVGLRRRQAPSPAFLVAALSIVAAAGAGAFVWTRQPSPSEHAFIYRVLHPTSGLSPIVPLILLVAAGLWRAWYSLTGLAYLDDRRPLLPTLLNVTGPTGADPRLLPLTEERNERLLSVMNPWNMEPRVLWPAATLTLMSFLLLDFSHPVRAIEGNWFEHMYGFGLLLVVAGLFLSLFRLVIVWVEFRKLLAALNALPLRRAFKDLGGFKWRPLWRPEGRPLTDSGRYLSRLAERLCELAAVGAIPPRTARSFALTQARLAKPQPHHDSRIVARFLRLRRQVGRLSGLFLQDLTPRWDRGDPSNPRTHSEEDFVARVFVNFMLVVMTRMRTLVLCVTGTFVLMALSFVSYPFEPRQSYEAVLVGLLLFVAAGLSVVFGRMHQDTILSLLTDTNPGELGIDFWIRIGSAVAIPLLSLLALQFPATGRALFSWVEPALRALK